MRRIAPPVCWLFTAAALTTLTAPLAQADDADFVREAHALGFTQASDNQISTAESAGYFLGLNRDPVQV